MRTLRVAIVGVGRIADMHYQAYAENPRAELIALCDADPVLLKRRSDEWAVEKTFSDFHELLDDQEIDAVDVVTPHHLHAPMTIAALEAGKHVSVQKPMALSITEADLMIAAADRSGKLLRVIDNYRFHPPFVRAKEIIESGGIGEPMSVRIKTASGVAPDGWTIPQSSHEWRSDPAQSGEGSVLFDHGHHVWTIARYLLGDIERVFAYTGQTKVKQHHEVVSGGMLDNPAMISWKYTGSDVYGSCESVHSEDLVVRSKYYPIDVSVEVTGTKGILYVNRGPNGQMVQRPPIEILRDGSMTSLSNFDVDYAAGFQHAIDDFVDAVLDGGQADLTGEEAREVLRFSLAMVRSGREGREVLVGDIS